MYIHEYVYKYTFMYVYVDLRGGWGERHAPR